MLRTVVRTQAVAEDIAQGIRLAKMYGRDISPAEVVRALDDANVQYVLVGAHATNGYTGAPRATLDVDVLVRYPKKAAAVLLDVFPELSAKDTPVVTRLVRPDGKVAIDLMKSKTSPLWGRILKISRVVPLEGAPIRIPPVEGMLAAKLAAMVSPLRESGKKMIDGGDFIQIVKTNPQLDLQLLEELGELVYSGGGKEILKLVADAQAGRTLVL